MLGTHGVLGPGLGYPASHIGNVRGEKVLFAEFSVFYVLKTEGNSMVKHGHPYGPAPICGNLTSEFHGGRNFSSRGGSGFSCPVEGWRWDPLIPNRKILTYTYRWVANVGQRFSSTYRRNKSAQQHKGNDDQNQQSAYCGDRQPAIDRRLRRSSFERRHWGP